MTASLVGCVDSRAVYVLFADGDWLSIVEIDSENEIFQRCLTVNKYIYSGNLTFLRILRRSFEIAPTLRRLPMTIKLGSGAR